MIRLFLQPEDLSSKQIKITGDNARYLSLVMRVKPGDPLIIFDGLGYRYECRILRSHKKETIAERIRREQYSVESPLSITLAQGIAKGERMDFIIQKATELGVSKIIPLITERSQVRHTEKMKRWQKISLSASQQSGRDRIPEVLEPTDINEFLKNLCTLPVSRDTSAESSGTESKPISSPQLEKMDKRGFPHKKIIFSEEKIERNLKQVLRNIKNTNQITLLIGPEGGFSKEEVTTAIEQSFIETSLGPRILRTETAPLAVISIIQYELGDIG